MPPTGFMRASLPALLLSSQLPGSACRSERQAHMQLRLGPTVPGARFSESDGAVAEGALALFLKIRHIGSERQ
jgi:hypothetical protein